MESSADYSHIKFEDRTWREEYTRRSYAKTQQQSDRVPIPGAGVLYPEHNWVKFEVMQKGSPIKLHTYRFPAEKERKAVFIIFHGLNSYVGKSAYIAQELSKHGIESVGFDYRGFGQSEGIYGWCESFEQHMNDSSRFLELVEQEYKGEHIFIGGQSWGGQTAYKLALTHPTKFSGVVLFTPAIKDNRIHVPFSKKIGKLLGLIIPSMQTFRKQQMQELISFPHAHILIHYLRVTPAQRHGFANKNPAVAEGVPLDPHMYQGRLVPGTIRTVLNASDEMEKTFKDFHAPFLILTAGTDKLVDPLLGFDLMKESPSADKEHVFYENCWHNIWAEVEIEDAIQQTIKWITKRIK